MASCPECIIAFGFEQLCLFVYFVNAFCTSGVYFTNANSLAYCGNLRLLKANFGPFCNGKKHRFDEILCRGTFCVFSKRCRVSPPPSEISRAQTARGKPRKPWAWHLGEKWTILLLICIAWTSRDPGQRAKPTALSTVQARRKGRGRWSCPRETEDSGWFRKSWEVWGGFSSRN